MTALMQAKRYDDVIDTIRRMPEWFSWHYAHLAGGYAQLGRANEAAATTAATLRAMPGFSIKWLLLQEPYKYPADTEHLVECLRKAGLPE